MTMDLLRRLEALEAANEQLEKIRNKNLPYAIIKCYSLAKDFWLLEEHPEGENGERWTSYLHADDVEGWCVAHSSIEIFLSFGTCEEWLMCQLIEHGNYTPEQIERFIAEWFRQYPIGSAAIGNADLYNLLISTPQIMRRERGN